MHAIGILDNSTAIQGVYIILMRSVLLYVRKSQQELICSVSVGGAVSALG